MNVAGNKSIMKSNWFFVSSALFAIEVIIRIVFNAVPKLYGSEIATLFAGLILFVLAMSGLSTFCAGIYSSSTGERK